MFKEIPKQPDIPSLEEKILKQWEEKDYFGKLVAKNKGNEIYSFIDGPITANNPMGVHHAWGRTFKDVFQRHRAMHGFEQRYQNGFDCQGLWVEVEVEKDLSLNSKKEILDFGLENFARACHARVEKYAKVQTEQSKRLGQWMDWDNSYYTFTDNNIEHIWYFLKECFEKGLLYKGHSVMPWCLRCGTSLSQHELADSYKDLVHPSVFIMLPLVEREEEYFMVWTTTPWTLPANTALAVNPDLDYLQVEQKGKLLWITEEAKDILTGEYKEVKKVKGKELLGLRYRGPFDELPVQKEVDHRVIAWKDVSSEDGTGIVHIAPGCGAEDFELSKEHDISVLAPIDEHCYYFEGFGFLAGQSVLDVREPVLNSLREKGYLYKLEELEHRYPVCWRCSEELVFRLEEEWFISCDQLRQPMLENSKKVKWQPEYAGKLMADWLNNMGDWCISRKRFWGLPLPFYPCECGYLTIVGSRQELEELAVKPMPDLPELHRPWIDEIKIVCPQCGAEVERIDEVGDCWLDAGIVPFSTLGYLNGPEGRKYWEKWFPADFVVEMREQIRLWFYSQLFMSTVLENKAPYRHVMTYEKVQDEIGRPMHKSWGNAIWFDDAVDKMGADIMRYIYTYRNPNNNLNFGFGIAEEAKRKLLTLWNAYSFFVTYARLDNWQPQTEFLEIPLADEVRNATDSASLLDRWLVAKIQASIKEVDNALFDYNTVGAVRNLEELVESISRWYIRRNRHRYWKSEEDDDKNRAYAVLYYALVTLSKLWAPLLPFMAEEIYQNLVAGVFPAQPESVHLCDFPICNESWLDNELLAEMDIIMEVTRLAHAARNQANIKVRQPLTQLDVVADKGLYEGINKGRAIIEDEVNVKKIFLKGEGQGLFAYQIKPNFPKVGAKYGPLVPKIQKALSSANGAEFKKKLEVAGEYRLTIDGQEIILLPEEVIIQRQMKEDLIVEEGDKVSVALHTIITPDLLREGLARDILRNIQTLRKDGGLEIDTRISLAVKAEGVLAESLREHAEYIKKEALANDMTFTDKIDKIISREIILAEGKVSIGLEPL